MLRPLLTAAALLLAPAVATAASHRHHTGPVRTTDARPPVTILISIDGFRADYLQRGASPVLSRLAANGLSAAMRPSFPSITFPNHWTIVTGLRPDRNGIVGNRMEDAARPGETFTMASEDPFWWNEAEPIWVAAERAGIRSATMFWPGANVAWGGSKTSASHNPFQGGTRPADWQQFSSYVSGEQRVAGVLDWLRRPAAIRPRLVTLYFDIVDSAGHDFGPDDPRTMAAVSTVDHEIGDLVTGLATLHQPANLVIVADHGMAVRANDRQIALDRFVPETSIRMVEDGAFAAIVPLPQHEAEVERALLAPHDHLRCWRKAEIPARFHYGANPRVTPIFCLADIGWEVRAKPPSKPVTGGTHGYDNDAPEMRALFIANGPAFSRARRLTTFDNVDVYPLLRDLLGLPPRHDVDGDDAPFHGLIRR